MKLKKKLTLSLAILLFASVTLITTTFAWFSIAQDATVGDLSMEISGGTELLVSLDGINYHDNIDTDLLKQYLGDKLEVTHVTTFDQENYFSSYDNEQGAIVNKDYLSFDIWFRTNDFMCTGLFLTNNITPNYNYETALNNKLRGTYCFSEGVKYTNPVDFQYSETEKRLANETHTYYAQDAMRIGIKELNVDLSPLKTEDNRTDLKKFIYDPSEDEDRGFGEIYGQYDILKQRVDSSILPPTNKPNTIYQLSSMQYNYYAVNNNSHCGDFQQGSDGYLYAKINVTIWCEGWDADCLDGILKDNVLMQLYFRGAVPAEPSNN